MQNISEQSLKKREKILYSAIGLVLVLFFINACLYPSDDKKFMELVASPVTTGLIVIFIEEVLVNGMKRKKFLSVVSIVWIIGLAVMIYFIYRSECKIVLIDKYMELLVSPITTGIAVSVATLLISKDDK